MEEFIWLFPIIFIFHDMEEIIGLGPWMAKNNIKLYKNFSTEGFALAVFEELIVCIILCILAFNSMFFKSLWLGAFIGCAFHFIVHFGQAIVLKKYIPALITSIICLPISIYIIWQCFAQITITTQLVISMVIGVLIVVINLILAQRLIGWFTINIMEKIKC
ncbi:HXXEE domain-containing protein [Methanobrevibacter gottschalkii]|uniref:HXXEE domain-containing protein n=1 Tax=Methanobrevibacter gottschalkii TaxID=190974 RepID=UPI0026EA35A3|nr:HXXEE domain-containing protein [Methanobrevibacter gottschalkii]